MSNETDINFFRFLTLHISMRPEDFILGGLFADINPTDIKQNVRKFFGKGDLRKSRDVSLYIHSPYCTEDCN